MFLAVAHYPNKPSFQFSPRSENKVTLRFGRKIYGTVAKNYLQVHGCLTKVAREKEKKTSKGEMTKSQPMLVNSNPSTLILRSK